MIKGNSIYLRIPEPEDVDFMLTIENNPKFWHVSDTIYPFSRFEIESFIINSDHDLFREKQLRLMICKNENDDIIGIIDLFEYHPLHRRAGIGIIISESEQGKGFAKEALELIENYAIKSLSLHQFFCNIHADNEISIKLFSSCGFIQQGIRKDWEMDGNRFVDVLFFQKIIES